MPVLARLPQRGARTLEGVKTSGCSYTVFPTREKSIHYITTALPPAMAPPPERKAPMANHRGEDYRGYKPSSVPLRASIIKLSTQPADRAFARVGASHASPPIWACSGWGLPWHAVFPTPVGSYPTFSPLPPRGEAVCFCGTLRHAGLPRARRSLQPTILLSGVRTFLTGFRLSASGETFRRACAIDRPGKRGRYIKIRPHAGQVTKGASGSRSAWSTACATAGGCLRLQPVQTCSARSKCTAQGQRVSDRRE